MLEVWGLSAQEGSGSDVCGLKVVGLPEKTGNLGLNRLLETT